MSEGKYGEIAIHCQSVESVRAPSARLDPDPARGTAALAQTNTARLEGTVQDQSGAVVPNARIVAVNTKTEITTRTSSNFEGYFVVTPLEPGTYNLTVEASGFRKHALVNIELDTGSSVSEIVKLELGQAAETVMVEAQNVSIQTSESQISRVVSLRDIDVLPQLGRQPLSLTVFAAPGVAVNPSAVAYSRINGQRQGSNNTTLDGIDVNDAVAPSLGLSLNANNTDSIAEFRIITQGAKAEYGRNAGGQVELITRSGTNDFHGNAFDYLRNTDLNANDFFNNTVGAARPLFIQNIFGGSFGGPIQHNKLFIFGNYQARRAHQSISRVRTVPTATAKQGLFLYKPIGSSAVSTVDLKAIDPQHIGIDPQIAKLLALFPAPNDTSVGDGLNSAGFRFNNPNGNLEDQFTIKADYSMTANHHFFMRDSWQRNSYIDSLNGADAPFPGEAQGTQGGHRWGISSGWDWTINSHLVNQVRYGHQSAMGDFLRPGDGKTAIRGNYGIFCDRTIGATASLVDSYTPGFADGEATNPNLQGGDFRASQNYPVPQHAAKPMLTPPDTRSIPYVFVFNPNLRTGYVHQYSLTLQRELLRSTVLEAGYVGSRGVKLFMDRDPDQAKVYPDFLKSFQELQAFCPASPCAGPAPPAGNTLVRIFGSPAAAVTGVSGATVLQQGALGTAANTVNIGAYTKFAAAGLTDFYLRSFPQFRHVVYGTNDGRSYYDSLQVSLRRNAGDAKFTLNYTFSKNLDNISVDGNGFTSPIDNFNLKLNKARSDWTIPRRSTGRSSMLSHGATGRSSAAGFRAGSIH